MAVTPKDVASRYKVGAKWVRQLARNEIAGHPRHGRWTWDRWDDPELQRVLQRLETGHPAEDVRDWETVLSAKNQMTLPTAALRALGLKPGQRLRILLKENSLELLAAPASWVEHYAGVARGLYGSTDKDIEMYLRESRGDWEPMVSQRPAQPRERWGDKSILIERCLQEKAEQVRDEQGRVHSLVPSFAKIARDFGVTRELVRQVAEDLGIQSYYRVPKSLKRQVNVN